MRLKLTRSYALLMDSRFTVKAKISARKRGYFTGKVVFNHSLLARLHSTENYRLCLSVGHALLLFDFSLVGQSIGDSFKDSSLRQGNTKQLT